MEIYINSFTPPEDETDRDKFLMAGLRMPLMGLYGESLYINAMFDSNSNKTGRTSFKPGLATWVQIEASQYVDNNEVT